jgi:exopolysaccharide production protein ExoZ
MYKSIQAGRAFAALSVAAYHLSITMGDVRYGGEPVFKNLTANGNLGVDFFFVLSGFIILFAHHTDIGKPANIPSYILKRTIRLYPIYLLYTIIISILVLLGIGSIKLPNTVIGWLSAIFLMRFSSESPPLEAAWTLFHEIMFYAIFSILIWNRRTGILALGAWGLLCLALYQYPGTTERTALNVYTSAYNLNFLFGMAAYALYKREDFGPYTVTIGIMATASGVALAYSDSEHYRLVFAVGCAILMGGLTAIEKCRNLYVPAFLILIGDASYTIYLTHSAMQGMLLKTAVRLGIMEIADPHFIYIIIIIITTFAGCAAYKIVEAPLLKFSRGVIIK